MTDQEARLARALNSAKTVIVSGITVVLGGALLGLASAQALWNGNVVVPAILSQAGGVLIAAVGLYIIWELVGRRAFAGEIMARLSLSSSVGEAGLTRVGNQYLAEAEWADLIGHAREIDVFLAYGATWRAAQWSHLQAAATRGAKLNVFLPDVDDDSLVERLSQRFAYDPNKTEQLVTEAAAEYSTLPHATVWRGPIEPVFSCYRFDDTIVATMYSHARTRTPVPVIICRRPGSLFDFFSNELVAIRKASKSW